VSAALQRRLLHNFTTINAVYPQGRAKLETTNQTEADNDDGY